ncbi:hypothetical protein K2173_013001 [Erythroxylum novogranatense]|uniref:Uncharacterized protein n=1 Tax=Erythroxylum novogranatense TaxID=1862640 RepID=A0AAV8S798_9ROSI|nr:hypothetical protein K2173_013001 [Erythroxylum novogranatense]
MWVAYKQQSRPRVSRTFLVNRGSVFEIDTITSALIHLDFFDKSGIDILMIHGSPVIGVCRKLLSSIG